MAQSALLFYCIACSARCQWSFEICILFESPCRMSCIHIYCYTFSVEMSKAFRISYFLLFTIRFFYFLSICSSLYCQQADCIAFQVFANFILYTAINVAGMYTKYLTDRGQRLAFIETHKAMEHKKESEKELQRTQKLLDSSE